MIEIAKKDERRHRTVFGAKKKKEMTMSTASLNEEFQERYVLTDDLDLRRILNQV